MTQDEALAIAREATRHAMAIHHAPEAVMAYLNHECRSDPELMEAFLVVGFSVAAESPAKPLPVFQD